MNVFDRSINFDALFKFSHISASTQEHLKRVYGSFALCMFVAAAGAYINVVTHLFQFGLLTGLGALGLMVWLTATPHNRETEQKRLGMLVGFAFLTGINLGPLLQMCISINPSIIPTAFLGTASIFACFSLSALYARRRSYLYLGGFLLSGLTLMLLSSLINAFVRSTWLFTANLYVALMIMCGFVLFDTQLIIEKAESGDKDYIWHCVDLFLDFVNIFRELLMILGMSEVGEGPWAGQGGRAAPWCGREPMVTVATFVLQNKKKEKK
ncbi:PREDICTED: bax inhibitor 1 isoform X1 [Pseudopodoces humilis]|uniref:bax inhibitor 1 isoform X1 n=1 Tax=Pseudopodoces humilis TaxID=181119 RepID=UPI0006B834C7|nr:PREDICTED: bax inhibitor 1 isoform X1 [Pseudopodoces humilis]